MTSPMTNDAVLLVASSKADVASHLNAAIVSVCESCLQKRDAFTIALSGGSLPSFLSSIPGAFEAAGQDPQFEKWHVLLADERCVAEDDPDSNLKAIKEKFTSLVPIPESQIHGIDQEVLQTSTTEQVATNYETIVREVLDKYSSGFLDLAVLGFGPDGHTCSLFPNHALLQEKSKLVAGITDSPKPPPERVTLTFTVLNSLTRHVILCGAGAAKSPILMKVFGSISAATPLKDGARRTVTMASPPPYPCAMVQPSCDMTSGEKDTCSKNTLTWVVDSDAMEGVIVPQE